MERMHPSAIVALRAGSFRTEVLQDDAGVVDLSELSHYQKSWRILKYCRRNFASPTWGKVVNVILFTDSTSR